MDFGLSYEEKMILQTVREFTDKEVRPLLPEVQKAEIRGERFPDRATVKALQGKARTAGLWGLQTPEEYGGANLTSLLNALIAMELGRSLVRSTSAVAPTIFSSLGPTNRSSATWCRPSKVNATRASPCRNRTPAQTPPTFRHAPSRTAVTGSSMARRPGSPMRTRRTTPSSSPLPTPVKRAKGGISAFLVDRDMGWTERPIALMSSWEASDMWFDSVRVPECNVLGTVGDGFGLAMQWIGRGRINIPARAVGQAQGLLQLGLDYARQRKAFGQPIAEYQAIQWMLADTAIEIEQVKWATLHAAWVADQGQDPRHYASIAKISGAQMVFRVADRMLQVHGGMGYTREIPIERILREVRVYRIFEGTDEIQKRTIARNLLRDYVRVGD